MRKISMMMAMYLLAGCASLPGGTSDKQATQSVVFDGTTAIAPPDCSTRPEAFRNECLATKEAMEKDAENRLLKKQNEELKEKLAAVKKGKAEKPKKPGPTLPAVAMAAMVMPETVPDPTMMADTVPPSSAADGDLWVHGHTVINELQGRTAGAMVCLIRRGVPVSIAIGSANGDGLRNWLSIQADMSPRDGVPDAAPYECAPVTSSTGIRIPDIGEGESVEFVYLVKSLRRSFYEAVARRELVGTRHPALSTKHMVLGSYLPPY